MSRHKRSNAPAPKRPAITTHVEPGQATGPTQFGPTLPPPPADGSVTLPQLFEVPPPAILAELALPGAKWYTLNGCLIYWRAEPKLGYHLSISHPHRYPTWDEVVYARYQLTPPGIAMALLIPPLAVYADAAARSHGFELWQVDGDALHQDDVPLWTGARP